MPGLDGLELLKQIVEKHPHIAVIIISARSEVEDVVTALKLGAFDYITKPIVLDEVLARVQRAIEYRRPAMRREPCSKCNREMQADWQYCPYDGTEIA